ncbi:MAG: hypothetical protein WBP61_13180 [Nocardioides sp.]
MLRRTNRARSRWVVALACAVVAVMLLLGSAPVTAAPAGTDRQGTGSERWFPTLEQMQTLYPEANDRWEVSSQVRRPGAPTKKRCSIYGALGGVAKNGWAYVYADGSSELGETWMRPVLARVTYRTERQAAWVFAAAKLRVRKCLQKSSHGIAKIKVLKTPKLGDQSLFYRTTDRRGDPVHAISALVRVGKVLLDGGVRNEVTAPGRRDAVTMMRYFEGAGSTS